MTRDHYLKLLREESTAHQLRIGIEPYIKPDDDLIIHDIESSFEVLDDSTLSQGITYFLSEAHLMTDQGKEDWINAYTSQIISKKQIIEIQIALLPEFDESKLTYGAKNTKEFLDNRLTYLTHFIEQELPKMRFLPAVNN